MVSLGRENGHVTKVDSLKEGESSLRRWAGLKEGEWSSYRGGQFYGGKMVTLRRWSVYWRENGNVTEVVTLMEGEWSCYRCGH